MACNQCYKKPGTPCSCKKKSPCNKCGPEPCNCHPCYNTLIGDCKSVIPATHLDACLDKPIYCPTGCDEELLANCILFPDGTNLTIKIQEILDAIARCCGGNTTAAGELKLECPKAQSIILPTGTINQVIDWVLPTATTTCPDTITMVTQASGPAKGSTVGIGTYTIIYQATDNCNNVTTCSFDITITQAAPELIVLGNNFCIDCNAGAKTLTLAEILSNDSDYDLSTFEIIGRPTKGTLVVQTDGTYKYTPATTLPNTDTATYQLCNSVGDCKTGTLTFNIICANSTCLGTPTQTWDLIAQLDGYVTGGTWAQGTSCNGLNSSTGMLDISNLNMVSPGDVNGVYYFTYTCGGTCIELRNIYHRASSITTITECDTPDIDCVKLNASTAIPSSTFGCSEYTYTWNIPGVDPNVVGVSTEITMDQYLATHALITSTCGNCDRSILYTNSVNPCLPIAYTGKIANIAGTPNNPLSFRYTGDIGAGVTTSDLDAMTVTIKATTQGAEQQIVETITTDAHNFTFLINNSNFAAQDINFEVEVVLLLNNGCNFTRTFMVDVINSTNASTSFDVTLSS